MSEKDKRSGAVYECFGSETPIYQAWIDNSNERQRLEEVLFDQFDRWCFNDPFFLREIGAGLGSAALRFRNVLDAKEVDFTYEAIDPFPSQLARFRAAVGDDPRFILKEGDFQTYQPEQRCDLGLAIHSLYYTPSFEEAITKLHDSSEKILLVHHGYHGINQVQLSFRDWVLQEANEISTHEDVCAALENLGIPYSVQEFVSEVDVYSCHDPQNLVGRDLIRFFLENPCLTDEQIAEVSAYFREKGSTMMEHDFVMITS